MADIYQWIEINALALTAKNYLCCMHIRSFVGALWLFSCLPVAGQQAHCYTNEIEQQIAAQDPAQWQRILALRKPDLSTWKTADESEYIIPVVVHIVYNNDMENLSDERITTQIIVLNEDFNRLNADSVNTPEPFLGVAAHCNIHFCLASYDPNGDTTSGITRDYTDTSIWDLAFSEKVKSAETGGADAWPSASYLNIWVCDLEDGVLGYAVSPGADPDIDGIVVDYRAFGLADIGSAPYNLGRTATHEVGHWLGLFHIWGDDGGSCAGTDLIDDTPNQAGPTYGCPDFPYYDECSPDYPGIMFMNYMDYADDACMNLFTNGQKARMRNVLETYRASILTSTAGCNAIIPPPGNVAELLIYPSPNNGQFTVSIRNFAGFGDQFYLDVYDALGRSFDHAEVEAANTTAHYFDISGLSRGCYFVRVFNGAYFLNGSFVVL